MGGSSLLKLPIEIRRIIYGFLFTCDRPIVLNQVSADRGRTESPAWPLMCCDSDTRAALSDSLAFLLVCNKFSDEAVEVLYTSNTFSSLWTIVLFLELIGRHNTEYLRIIHLFYEENMLVGYEQALRRLALLKNLKLLEITLPLEEPQLWHCYAGITVRLRLPMPYQLVLGNEERYLSFLTGDTYRGRRLLGSELVSVENQVELHPLLSGFVTDCLKHFDECEGTSCSGPNRGQDDHKQSDQGNPPRKSNFLSLPSNVQKIIYDDAFKRSRPTSLIYQVVSWLVPHYYIFPTGFRYAPNGYPNEAISLVRVCRQFHQDYSPLLYGENNFELREGPPDLWLNQIGPANEGALRSVHLVYFAQLEYWIPQLRNALQRLATLSQLRDFRFTVQRTRVPYMNLLARRLREMRASLAGKETSSFAIITKDNTKQEQGLDVAWVIDEAEPWGWDHGKRQWRAYSEIMTRNLLDLARSISQTPEEPVDWAHGRNRSHCITMGFGIKNPFT